LAGCQRGTSPIAAGHRHDYVEKYKMFGYCKETALQGGLVMAKSERLELGDNISRTFDNYDTELLE